MNYIRHPRQICSPITDITPAFFHFALIEVHQSGRSTSAFLPMVSSFAHMLKCMCATSVVLFPQTHNPSLPVRKSQMRDIFANLTRGPHNCKSGHIQGWLRNCYGPECLKRRDDKISCGIWVGRWDRKRTLGENPRNVSKVGTSVHNNVPALVL